MKNLTLAICFSIAAILSFAGTSHAQRFQSKSKISATKSKLTSKHMFAEAKLIADAKSLATMPAVQQLSGKYAATMQRVSPVQMMATLRPEIAEMLAAARAKLADEENDFVVEWAEPFEGQSEYVLDVIYPGESSWSRYHDIGWCGSVDHGGPCDQGEMVFPFYHWADNEGEDLLEDGEITDYRVVERPLTPSWQYIETYDTLGQAESAADAIETAAALLGEDRIVRIRMVPVSD